MGLGRFVTSPFGNVSSFIFQVEKKYAQTNEWHY